MPQPLLAPNAPPQSIKCCHLQNGLSEASPLSLLASQGRGALSIKVIKPTWERAGAESLRLGRAGTLLLEFANSKGEREYDWERKEVFGLSAVECGELLEAVEGGREKSFFHDPNKMGP
jgi:hypothetical protein